MIAKIIAHSENRDNARRKLISTLEQTTLFGVKTNRAFLLEALTHADFVNGEATTAFIGENFQKDKLAEMPLSQEDAITAAMAQYLLSRDESLKISLPIPNCLLYTSPSPRDATLSRMPSSA